MVDIPGVGLGFDFLTLTQGAQVFIKHENLFKIPSGTHTPKRGPHAILLSNGSDRSSMDIDRTVVARGEPWAGLSTDIYGGFFHPPVDEDLWPRPDSRHARILLGPGQVRLNL